MIDTNRRNKEIRCAIYTRKSTTEGLEQEFNSLDAQRESCSSYIASQRHEGWVEIDKLYDDGGFTGGNMERPALKRLMDSPIATDRWDAAVMMLTVDGVKALDAVLGGLEADITLYSWQLPDESILLPDFAVADVCGKGLQAALISSSLHTMVRATPSVANTTIAMRKISNT